MKSDKQPRFLGQALRITFKSYYWHATLLILAIGSGAVIAAWPALVLRQVVDSALQKNSDRLWQMAFTYLGALVLIALSDLVREYGAMVFGQKMLVQLRSQMLDRLRQLPMSYYLSTPAGETLSRLTADIDAVNTLFTAGLISAAADLLKIAGLITALFTLSVPLGLIALIALPVIYVMSDFFRRRIFQRQLVVRKRVAEINTSILETYSGLKIIKVFGLEWRFAERFEPVLENHRLAMNGNSVYDALFPCIMQIVRATAIAIAIVVGAQNNLTSLALGLSLGALAAAADLFMRLFDPIESAAAELQTIQQAMAGLKRIKEFFSQPVESPVKPLPENDRLTNAVSIEIANVSFAYSEGKSVLNGANMVIPAGTKAAIAGRTGSGKTTLINLVAGLYPVQNGQIKINGLDPYLLPPTVRRRLIGIVPQTVTIFNGSIIDNVTLRDRSISADQVRLALQQVGLLEHVLALPDQLETKLGEGESKLSFGQNQLLSLARAIVTDPPVLLLDELTSGLDALTERQVLTAIRQISSSKTILTISHRLSGIIDAETVHIMDHGQIVESGRPEDLARKEGWYARYKRLEEYGWQV
jgi:ATP-binding cassette, subfamily B, multidrug efflux pump